MSKDFEQFADEIRDGLTEWATPVPFDEIKTPDFPTERLPGPLADYVKALAENTQTPEEMAGLLILGVLATAFQSRYEVEVTPDWHEPLCLYCVAVAPPGERKSSVISALTRPIHEYEAALFEHDKAAIQRNNTEREILEQQLSIAKKAAANGKGSPAQALQLSEQLAKFPVLHQRRLLTDDATPEKLVDMMDAQSGCITICSAEGGIFDAMKGRYDQPGNFDIYLKGHAGDPVIVDRMGRKSNMIEHPRLSMILTIQPEVLAGLMDNRTYRSRGLCGRFLYAMCKSKVGHRDIDPPAIPDGIKRGYTELIKRILSGKGKGIIRLDEAANDLRSRFQKIIETKLGDEWADMTDWGGKCTGAMVRIAALIHCAQAKGEPSETPINGETMIAAMSIAEYLGAHAEAAYQVMGANEDYTNAKYLLRRIKGFDKISERDLFQRCKGKFKRVEDMRPALDLLIDMDYLRASDIATGGRPSTMLMVNPNVRR